jgi:hypothetical protein
MGGGLHDGIIGLVQHRNSRHGAGNIAARLMVVLDRRTLFTDNIRAWVVHHHIMMLTTITADFSCI